MKVIDLLNKIANGEKVPDFKIFDEEYYVKNRVVFSKKDGNSISWAIYQGWLNNEIEIIEEPKKIEKIKWNEKSNFVNCDMSKTGICEMMMARSEQLKKSLNEIIDYINKDKE